MLRTRFVAVFLFLLSGCVSATPKLQIIAVPVGEAELGDHFAPQLVLEQRSFDHHRLETIRFRLGRAAVGFCPGKTRPEFGFAVANQYSFGQGDRRLATSAYGFDDRLRVLHVIKSSPAYNAGLRSGDYIVAVNGTEIPTGSGAKAAYREAADRYGGTRLNLTIEPVEAIGGTAAAGRLGLAGQNRKVAKLIAVKTCRFSIEMTRSNMVGAYATGGGVTITKGMIWFAKGDELAFVVSHELVHVIREHHRMIGRFGVRQKDVEAEADYLGLYVMARAGYEIGIAPRFWRRIAAYFPGFGGNGRTHGTASNRIIAMRRAISEINAKMVGGSALVPG